MAASEQVIRAATQLGTLLRGVRQQQGLSQQDLALKAGGTSQARLSQLELQPGRLTLGRLLLILAALDLELVVRARQISSEPTEC
ncbi:MAG: HTH-type transcriptional regulator/antitoxin HipB [Cyanobium sp.]|jgi:HTH-type transcriptional regulator/antitoxin HipB|uniref:helix-turn-helix domain-containing protein n=1 Tax=Synechococcus sp. CS-1331 TaxID=2847973 RepID=UPI00223B8ED7|nr:helix-turn-helix transcriptional regulator [Synechococcus sp. CS-1331]MCT0227058.1 helix-turn-helix domain-containing protein [Synechococcus sp. CS-1331]